MPSSISPNMGLVIPTVGQEPGPTWASDLNVSLSTVDQHNHTPGQGVQIPTTGLNINVDLPFNGVSATALQSVAFTAQGVPLSGSLIDRIYVSGVDLYYNDGVGNQIRMTASGTVNGSTGTITGLPSGTASASFNSLTNTFAFQSATNTPANMALGPVTLSRNVASGPTVLLTPSGSQSSNYSFVLPAAVAATNGSLLSSDTSGNSTWSTTLSAAYTLSGSLSGGSWLGSPTLSGTVTFTAPSSQGHLLIRGGGGAAGDIRFYDSADTNSARVRFFGGGVAAGNPSFALPNVTVDDIFALLIATQTLTNKTLTAPIIDSITGASNTFALSGIGSINYFAPASQAAAFFFAVNGGSSSSFLGADFNHTLLVDSGSGDMCFNASSRSLRFSTDATNTQGSCTAGAWILGTGTGQDVQHQINSSSATNIALLLRNRNSAQQLGTPTLQVSRGPSSATNAQFIHCVYNDGASDAGYIGFNGSVLTFFGPSDRTLKTNIRPLTSGLDKILALKPATFDFIDGRSTNQVGFIAQEMQDVFPEDVCPSSAGTLLLSGWSRQLAYLVSAIQEQQTVITTLQEQIKALQ